MSTATRVAGLTTSSIRAIAAGAPSDAISLALGEPGWPLPDPARQALNTWAQTAQHCSYGPNQGIPELVQALRGYTGLTPEEFMVTAGSQAGMFAVFQAHVEPGSQVLIPDPGFPAYETLATLAGAEVVRYPLAADHGFALDAQALITTLEGAPRTSLVVIGHPANPTGGGASREALRAVAQRLETDGITLLSDEVYRQLWLDEKPTSVREVSQSSLVLESVSKGWAAPGLRVGWVSGPAHLLAPARLLHNAMNTAPARPSQLAAAALLDDSAAVLEQSRAQVQRRWDALAASAPILQARQLPAGGFYHWLELPRWAHCDPMAFIMRVRDEGKVLVVPGAAFGPAGQNFARLSLGGSLDTIRDGLARLAPWWERQC